MFSKLVGKIKGSFKSFPDPCKRRFEGGQLKGLSPDYFVRCNRLLRPLMDRVDGQEVWSDDLLLTPGLAEMSERVVEYPRVLAFLKEEARAERVQLLDVGCVLNNNIMNPYLPAIVNFLGFLNPSLESLKINMAAGYFLSDIRKPIFPDRVTFDVITCMSTLEHVGMDNTRYGGDPQEYRDGDQVESFAIAAVKGVSAFVKPGGSLFITVPFGPFEFLYEYGRPNAPLYYTFGETQLLALMDSMTGFKLEVEIYKIVSGEGWIRTDLTDQKILKYGDQCASAGGVAILIARKNVV